VVPEQATIFHYGGVHYPATLGSIATMAWESSRMLCQMSMEDAYSRIAMATGKPSIILCDRGTMDTKAYMPEEQWLSMIGQMQWNVVGLRDRRYDAVVHMVTAASGAESFYTLANNQARKESIEQAIDLDVKTREAWLGHRKFRIVDNSTDFPTKVRRVTEIFCSLLGMPGPHGRRRYFLVQLAPGQDNVYGLPVKAQECYLTSTFLTKKEDGCDIVLRRRGQDGHYTYSMHFKNTADGGRWIRSRSINSKQYLTMLDHLDPSLRPVSRRRLCFQWNKEYYELDQPANATLDGEMVLIVETDQNAPVEVPPFFTMRKEITGEYSLRKLAQGKNILEISDITTNNNNNNINRVNSAKSAPIRVT